MAIRLIVFVSILCSASAYFTVNIYENDMTNMNKCNPIACYQLCRRMGCVRGNYINHNRCHCEHFADTGVGNLDEVSFNAENPDINQLRGCNLPSCYLLCRLLGFPGGACVDGKCKCGNFHTSNTIEGEYSEDITALHDCNYQECDQRCRRLGFPGGACVGDRCKCDNFRRVQFSRDNVISTDNQLENDVKCELSLCESTCTQRGQRSGICIENECYCETENYN